jgi:hypothetical protein
MKHLALYIILFILVANLNPVLAATQNYESAATARIVGSSPADMIKQLQNNKGMNLKNAQ